MRSIQEKQKKTYRRKLNLHHSPRYSQIYLLIVIVVWPTFSSRLKVEVERYDEEGSLSF